MTKPEIRKQLRRLAEKRDQLARAHWESTKDGFPLPDFDAEYAALQTELQRLRMSL